MWSGVSPFSSCMFSIASNGKKLIKWFVILSLEKKNHKTKWGYFDLRNCQEYNRWWPSWTWKRHSGRATIRVCCRELWEDSDLIWTSVWIHLPCRSAQSTMFNIKLQSWLVTILATCRYKYIVNIYGRDKTILYECKKGSLRLSKSTSSFASPGISHTYCPYHLG